MTLTKEFTSLADPGFRSLFSEFRFTAYRLETLQHYDVSYEEDTYRRFLAGLPRGDTPSIRPWAQRVTNGRAEGKRFQRVHIVEEPLTDYIRFECAWSYRDSTVAGEDIRILKTARAEWPGDLPRQDYWLFDSAVLVIMKYCDEGAFVAAQIVNEPAEIVKANQWRDEAVSLSVPFAVFDKGFDELMHRV